MKRASTILQDAGAVRWTAIELHDWLNQALVEIATMKPNAKTAVVELDLVPGTVQELAAEYTCLSRVMRNAGATGGRAITTLFRREILDQQMPGWQDSTVLPNAAVVSMVFQDLAAPRTFWVVPGNTGTGSIEAIVGMNPTPVALPVQVADRLLVDNYTNNVDLPDAYQTIVLDLLLFRAFSKDSAAPDAAGRANAHFQKAAAAVQALIAGESAMSLAGSVAAQAAAG
ncbi:hypothetical protein FNJ84_17675 [Paracoccus sp. M683]|nr:DUF6682 family protein [Paracoccus sp. M683]TRW94922.1 hypothetical protein FNJ84_17675 [Paracoccus sp. M683]